jgi:site-specific recombinase XerD
MLRHLFATRFLEKNSNIKTLSELLGHSNINITLKLYVHSSNEQKRDCMNLMRFAA